MRRTSKTHALTLALVLTLAVGLLARPVPVRAADASMLVSEVPEAGRRIALTFDFGSDATNVQPILKILSDHQVRSTFFVTGQAADTYPSAVRSILAGGHEIGNHSYSHPDFTTLSTTRMKDEILRGETAIRNATGQLPQKMFRPPEGEYNSTVLQAVGDAGYPHTIMWRISTGDWQGISAAEILQRVTSRASSGAIVLMHVGGGTHTPEALPGIITSLRGMGYELVTVTRLLGLSGGTTRYTVQPGDTLYSIARRFGVTVQSIVTANSIADPSRIYPGQVLVIPGTSPMPGTDVRYTVQPGDTLYAIARRFGVTVQSIVTVNSIADPDRIYPGQVLVIPAPAPTPGTDVRYTVQPGDTLYAIARRFGVTVQSIVTANSIADPDRIYPGQVLVIPQ